MTGRRSSQSGEVLSSAGGEGKERGEREEGRGKGVVRGREKGGNGKERGRGKGEGEGRKGGVECVFV